MTGPLADALLPAVGFLPGEIPGFFRLCDPERDGEERTRAAVRALRTMGHRVDTEPPFDVAGTTLPPRGQADTAFAQHPDWGIVAAAADGLPIHPGAILSHAGWHYRPGLDLYLAPAQRGEGLDAVAVAVKRLQRGHYTTAVQPDLAHAVRIRGTDTREPIRVTVFPGAHARLASLAAEFSNPAKPAAPRSNATTHTDAPAAGPSAPPRPRSR
ncbi:hypothetical protein [Kitasatospora sp. NPDC088783]|uniref:hypothetical protein n=1 Tax=Kitasatospora sp. NPDC088783 TaxID=3364077 RepID=UPI00380B8C3A